MTDNPDKPGPGSLEAPFLFVPHGAPEPAEWMRRHPGWVKFPATFVPHAPAAQRMIPSTNRPWPVDKRGQPWPASRFGQPLRPLDESPPGMRAPGEGYTGPIASGRVDADVNTPVKAYLSSPAVFENPGKFAGYPPRTPGPRRRLHLILVSVRKVSCCSH